VQTKAVVPSRLLRIPDQTFRELIASCPSVATTVVRTLVERVRRFQVMLQDREKLAGLGTIAAGLAHELNNPSAAANRAAMQAMEVLDDLRTIGRQFIARHWQDGEIAMVQELDADLTNADDIRAEVTSLDPLARSDREDALANTLAKHGVEDPWECAPGLVAIGLTPERLEQLATNINQESLSAGLLYVERRAVLRQLLTEVRASTGRIAELVLAVKAYSHADTVTPKAADVHFAIENTLTMFNYKLRAANVAVDRAYDRTLPKIATYGSELHQVWTNLIDNAIDAMVAAPGRTHPGGTLRIETKREGNEARVDVIDDGPGIPAEVLPKIFDPFFTTKDVGKGTGLGLEIVQRIAQHHSGSVSVTSKPGETRFTLRLPLAQGASA
jgi:signal transduction histidine kinase